MAGCQGRFSELAGDGGMKFTAPQVDAYPHVVAGGPRVPVR